MQEAHRAQPLKIEAALSPNARATVALRREADWREFVLSFAPDPPPAWADTAGMATTSAESTALSRRAARLRVRRSHHDVRAHGGDRSSTRTSWSCFRRS